MTGVNPADIALDFLHSELWQAVHNIRASVQSWWNSRGCQPGQICQAGIEPEGRLLDEFIQEPEAGSVATDSEPQPSRGSTGRTEPANLNEQIAMKAAKSDPANGKRLDDVKMTDPRWPASEGWVKMSRNVNGVEVHYVYNVNTGMTDDWKFK